MILSQHITNCRDTLDDANAQVALRKWTDDEIVRHTDEVQRVLFRRMVKSNKEWSNMTINLLKTDARTLFKNTYEWRLPTWIEAVTRVFERTISATTQNTFSPYLSTGTTGVDFGKEIGKTDNKRKDGWSWEGNHTLRLWNWTTVPDLTLMVAAQPPPMFKARIATAYADGTGFYLPPTPVLGTYHFEEGRYVNTEVQVSSCASATSTNLGETRRVIYSRSNAINAGTRQMELRNDSPWLSALVIDDVVESMLTVPDTHARLLCLKTCIACGAKKANLDLQRYLAEELRNEESAFMEYAEAPRDKAGPYFKTSGSRSTRPYDADRRNFPYLPWWS